jgi:NADH-quinone oxidoreductase subunit N
MELFTFLFAEIILVVAACALFLSGFLKGKVGSRGIAGLAVGALVAALVVSLVQYLNIPQSTREIVTDTFGNLRVTEFSALMRVIALSVSILVVLLSWPSTQTGNRVVDWGRDTGEYFGLLLLSITGLILCCQANDLIVLFMAIELASIPTYILVSVGRPLPAAQEAGVKYFFLGALAASILLMGFAYLYGTTGTTNILEIARIFAAEGNNADGSPMLTPWQMLAAIMVVIAVGFKLAAVPLHAYAADVYQGAATPITALLGFVPKCVGVVIQIKVLLALGGGSFNVPPTIEKLLWVLAVLTMTFGNLLGLTQNNVKRVLAYSSVGHSGYMLAGLAIMAMIPNTALQETALQAVIFYMLIYGLTSTAAFGILSLIPTKQAIVVDGKKLASPASSAETFEDITGVGRRYPMLGLGMAIACFALVGLPLTAGFLGKVFLISPALSFASGNSLPGLNGWLVALVVFMILNSVTGAYFYLRIVATMFARSPVVGEDNLDIPAATMPARVATGFAVVSVALIGVLLPLAETLSNAARTAASSLTVIKPVDSPVADSTTPSEMKIR